MKKFLTGLKERVKTGQFWYVLTVVVSALSAGFGMPLTKTEKIIAIITAIGTSCIYIFQTTRKKAEHEIDIMHGYMDEETEEENNGKNC